MRKFNEELLQFIWRNKLLKPGAIKSISGKEIVILDPGEQNTDAGPDFFNARIRLEGLTLAGNVELHIRTSDWLKHQHQHNKSYDNLVLHAVYEHDLELQQNTEHQVEILELKELIEEETLKTYEQMAGAAVKLPCAGQLHKVDDVRFSSWLERMTLARLEEKLERLEQYFLESKGDYAQTFYISLSRSFGAKTNALPFELLAKTLPVNLLLKHADGLLQLEALLLGMAGFLEEPFHDRYMQELAKEFAFLKEKYKLQSLQKELFKFSRLRPANFPTVRLSQLALLIHKNRQLFSDPGKLKSYDELIQALCLSPEGYWKNHYKADSPETPKEISFGRLAAELVLINTFAPFFFFYAKKLLKREYTEAGIALLKHCKMEVNAKTKLFAARRQNLVNAASSQGLIHLYDRYCSSRKCLQCGVAAAVLSPGYQQSRADRSS